MSQTITPDYPYQIEQQGNDQHITYRKASLNYKAVIPFAFYLAFPSIFLASAVKPSGLLSAVFCWLFFMIGIAFLIVYLMNLSKSKQGKFIISDKDMTVDGKSYAFEHVKTISIKDPAGNYVSDTVVVSNGSLASGMRGLSIAFGDILKNQTRQTQFKLVLRYATKDVVFAKGLNENDAEALFEKVTQVTGYTQSV